MIDYEYIKQLAKQQGSRVSDLLALAPQNDPFYMGTPADVASAEWFSDIYHAAGYSQYRAPHLRRVHYWAVSQKVPIKMPNGLPYENTQKCWDYLMVASKTARYLELVPLTGIVDNKNPQAIEWALYYDDTPNYEIRVPDFSPDFDIYGLHRTNAQPYHLEIWCEKSTMNDVLQPLCQRYSANLVTFEGEVSITSVCVNLMRRIDGSDGKPTRIFYISDFDPAGNSMPVAMSRKLEYAVRTSSTGYDIRVKPIALTLAQVRQYRLPRIPIKETERRAEKFEEAFGAGAVELDALEALHPDALRTIVARELAPYHSEDADQEIEQSLKAFEADLTAKIKAVTARHQQEIDALKVMRQELSEIEVDAEQYRVLPFDPHVDEDDSDWLYNSDRGYAEQISFYKAHKGMVQT